MKHRRGLTLMDVLAQRVDTYRKAHPESATNVPTIVAWLKQTNPRDYSRSQQLHTLVESCLRKLPPSRVDVNAGKEEGAAPGPKRRKVGADKMGAVRAREVEGAGAMKSALANGRRDHIVSDGDGRSRGATEGAEDGADHRDGGGDGDGGEDDSSDNLHPDPAGIRLMENPRHNLLNASLAAKYGSQTAPNGPGGDELGHGEDRTRAATPAAPACGRASGPEAAAAGVAPSRTRPRGRQGRRGGFAGDVSGHGWETQAGGAAHGRSSRLRVQPKQAAATFADLGGMDDTLQDLWEIVGYPVTHPEVYVHLGVGWPRGILLHGPPGCGKTLLAHAVAGELGVPLLKVSAPEIVSGMSGESEAKVRDLFKDAKYAAPCIVFIDEIDAIAGKRESAGREMERRIVAQLLTCMDDLGTASGALLPAAEAHAVAEGGGGAAGAGAPAAAPAANQGEGEAGGDDVAAGPLPVIVVAATNRPDAIDPALRRAGRFDREIAVKAPDAAARARILRVLCRGLRLAGDFDFERVGAACAGFVGADLAALAKEAAVIAVNRTFSRLLATQQASADGHASAPPAAAAAAAVETEGSTASMRAAAALAARVDARKRLAHLPRPLPAASLVGLDINEDDFWRGLGNVQPSARREGFSTVPDVTWADVGALADLREELTAKLLHPLKNPNKYLALGLSVSAGVLLYGPPGCGKTLLAKATANESGACFIAVKGPELLNKFVGESERAVRQVFSRAAASPPCIVFFDELDALCPRRAGDPSSTGGSSERVVNQLLTEMDGLDARHQVSVIGATNRPDMIDEAMLRPGRLDKCLYVPLPPAEARGEILRAACRKLPLDASVDLDDLGRSHCCDGFSGADLSALVKEAAMSALADCRTDDEVPLVTRAHFDMALGKVSPSVTAREERRYLAIRNNMRKARIRDPSDAGEPPGAPTGAV